MTARIFVDTNVFAYAKQASEHTKQQLAARWLERLWEEQTGRTSVQVLSEYYTTLTRKIKPALPPADAWDDAKSLIAWNPQPMDLELLHRGREVEQRYRLSWWDSLIVGRKARETRCVIYVQASRIVCLKEGAYAGKVISTWLGLGYRDVVFRVVRVSCCLCVFGLHRRHPS
jgi:predicted nucleic acid-binding protein